MMKVAIASAALTFGLSAQAAQSYLSCSNGTRETAGDNFFEMELHSDKIEIRPYESGFTVGVNELVVSGNTLLIKDFETSYTSEGDEEYGVLNAQINVSADKKTAVVSYNIDFEGWSSYILNCVTK